MDIYKVCVDLLFSPLNVCCILGVLYVRCMHVLHSMFNPFQTDHSKILGCGNCSKIEMYSKISCLNHQTKSWSNNCPP